VILSGKPGSGKSALVRLLAGLTGRAEQQIEVMHIHSQMDAGDLVGQFAQAEESGTFVWRESALVKALVEGKWLILANAHE
jgi:midasin